MITFQTLITRLIWICILPLIMLALILAVIEAMSVQREVDLAANSLAINAMVAIDQYLGARIDGLQALAASPLADNSLRWHDLYNESVGYYQSYGTHVILADRQEHMLFNTRVPFGTALPMLPHVEGHSAMLDAVATGRPGISDRLIGPVAKTALVAIAVPVIRDKKVAFVFLTTIETSAFQTQLDLMAKRAGWNIALVDDHGNLIASSGSVPAALPGNDNDTVVHFKASSTAAPWQVVIQIPNLVYWRPVGSAAAFLLCSILAAVFLGIVGGKITGRRLADSVASLAETAPRTTSVTDITEIVAVRQRLEQAAAYRSKTESELDNFKTIVESTEDAIISKTLDGTIISWNHGAETMFGYSANEAIGQRIDMLIPTERRDEESDILAHISRGERLARFETVRRRKDGSLIQVSTSIAPILDAAEHPIGASKIARDITEQTMARDQIQSGKAILEAALASMNDAVFVSDLNGNFIHINAAFATFHKFASKDECVKTLTDYPAFLDVILPDGALLPLEQWAVPRALRGETGVNAEYTLYRKDTGQRWTGSYNFAPIRNKDGEIEGAVVTARDITERVKTENEIRLLNVELEQRVLERTADLTASNQELDSFAYAVSHDLRGPLRAMNGFSQALAEDYGELLQGEAKIYLDQIGIASRKMSDLIDGILSLSRVNRGELKRDTVDLSVLAEELLRALQAQEPARAVEWHIEPGLVAQGDARMIEAALGNLLDNAWKYTAKTAEPVIRMDACEVDGQPGFCVGDNGAGFDMAHIERLFKPFQRLHRQDEFAGMGIGLATVQRIIVRHGGTIHARGQPGQGAVFSFTLPARI